MHGINLHSGVKMGFYDNSLEQEMIIEGEQIQRTDWTKTIFGGDVKRP
jgi:hypothetical protein